MNSERSDPLAPPDRPERIPQEELAEIRAFYDEHAPLDAHEHKTLIQRVRDEWHDFMVVVDHCSEVYDHFSRGRISKPMTLPREVITLAEDFATEDIEEAIKEAREEWEVDVAVPARAHQWTSVDTALPEGGDKRKLVWLVDFDGMAWIGIRVHVTRNEWFNNNKPELATVTHWMDLPERPGLEQVPARAHQEETEDEDDESVSRVDGERLLDGTRSTAKISTGDK